jgi:hypothetical protein
MKKLIFVSLLCVSFHGYSQSFTSALLGRLSFGLKAGANYSNYVNTDFATDALVGFHAGALVNFRLTSRLSIQEEFLFSTQGAKVKEDVFGKDKINVYYMNVPFLLKYRMPLGLYVELGPQVGMRLKEDPEHTADGNFAKRLDLSAAGGIGFQTHSGFGIGARYIAGISKVGDFNISNVKPDFRSSIVQASVFYIF